MKSIKKVGIAAALAGCLMLPACTASQAGGKCELKGTINGLEGEWMNLVYTVQDTVQVKDSVRITDGTFAFRCQLEAPVVRAALYVGDLSDYANAKIASLYMEPGKMTVALDTASFRTPEVTGSVSQIESDSLNMALEQIQQATQVVQDSLRSGLYPERQEAFEAQLEEAGNQRIQLVKEFIKTHPASFVAADQLIYMTGYMTYEELKAVYDNLSDEVKQYTNLQDVSQELTALGRVQPGMPAPYFRAVSWKGDSISVADLKGKYVLLDFWASWCVPCRKSFPHVKELYKKYHDQGFEVFCVADNDNSTDKWLEAIEQDGVQDFYHVLRGLKWDRSKGMAGLDHTNDISDLYAVHFLPTKYLIDREGNIVGKFNDEELDAKLKEIFSDEK